MDKEELAAWYGNEMRRLGMSHYNTKMNIPDPTPILMARKEFEMLSPKEKDALLVFGKKSFKFGMGMYQERGPAQEYYDECGGKAPEFTFNEPSNPEKKVESKESLNPEPDSVTDYLKKVKDAIKRFKDYYGGDKNFEQKSAEQIVKEMERRYSFIEKYNQKDDDRLLNEIVKICGILDLDLSKKESREEAIKTYASFSNGNICSKKLVAEALLKSKHGEVFSNEIKEEYYKAVGGVVGKSRSRIIENLKEVRELIDQIENENQNQPC